MLKKNFLKYEPEKELRFDEGTCPFKSRVRFRMYNPDKPNTFGIKLYQVCEASSDYCVGFDIYHGLTVCIETVQVRESTDDEGYPIGYYDNLTTTTKIFLGLLRQSGCLEKGHVVFMDNYYNSPELLTELDCLNTYACGTVRRNRRDVPKAFGTVKLRQGEGIFRRKGNLLALKFRDEMDIHMLSSVHEATLSVTNKVDGATCQPIMKPTTIVDSVHSMGGVDVSDQMVHHYDILRKSVK